jgi:hypothetical protein
LEKYVSREGRASAKAGKMWLLRKYVFLLRTEGRLVWKEYSEQNGEDEKMKSTANSCQGWDQTQV